MSGVAVLGVGGLGHLGVQYAAKMGYHTVAIARGKDKEPLARQLSGILEYVARLSGVPAGETARPFVAGPDAIILRPDEVRPWPLALPPAKLAPAFRDGFFTVPRLGQFEEDAEDEA